MAKAAPPKRHVFAPLLTIDCDEQTITGTLVLGYPLFGSDVLLHVLAQPRLCLQRWILSLNVPPLYRLPVSFLFVLGRDYPLIGVDTENSEVVRKAPHPLFSLPLCRTRTSHEFYASCAVSYQCSRFPRLHQDVKAEDRVITTIVISPFDAAGQEEAVIGSMQRNVVAPERDPRDAAVQDYTGDFRIQHPDL